MLTTDKIDETKHSGQRDLGPRKNMWKEKKREPANLLPSIAADIGSRNIKRKHRRKDIKSTLRMPVKTDGKRSMSRLPANAVAVVIYLTVPFSFRIVYINILFVMIL